MWWPWTNQAEAAHNRLMRAGPDKVPVEERVFGTTEDKLRPQMLQLINCKTVLLEDYTSGNPPFWNNHLVYCDGVIVRNIRLLSKEHTPNGDGLDIDSCKNVYVTGLFADVVTML